MTYILVSMVAAVCSVQENGQWENEKKICREEMKLQTQQVVLQCRKHREIFLWQLLFCH